MAAGGDPWPIRVGRAIISFPGRIPCGSSPRVRFRRLLIAVPWIPRALGPMRGFVGGTTFGE